MAPKGLALEDIVSDGSLEGKDRNSNGIRRMESAEAEQTSGCEGVQY